MLTSIGFVWENSTYTWNKNYDAFKKFCSENGHSMVSCALYLLWQLSEKLIACCGASLLGDLGAEDFGHDRGFQRLQMV